MLDVQFRRTGDVSSPSSFDVRVDLAWAVGIGVMGTTLGLVRLGRKALWHDEAFSAATVELDFATILRVITTGESLTGLYFGILHYWTYWGNSEVWLRLPSVMFGSLAQLALFALNRRLFGLVTAVIAGVLLAVNPFFVRYEQEVRPYTLALFLAVLATYALVQVATKPSSTRRWLTYAVTSALMVYAHVFSGFVLLAHLLALTIPPARARLRTVIPAYALIAVLVAPLFFAIFASQTLELSFVPVPDLDSFRWIFLHLTGAAYAGTRTARLLSTGYFLLCCVTVIQTLRAQSGGRGARQQRGDTWPYWLVLFWLIVPLIVAFVLSIARPTMSIFYPR